VSNHIVKIPATSQNPGDPVHINQ